MYERLYCVYDVVAQRPLNGVFMFVPSHAAAARMLADLVAGGKSEVSAHPRDFIVVFVATVDTETLVLSPVEWPLRSPVAQGGQLREETRDLFAAEG